MKNIWFWWWEVNISGRDFLLVTMLKYESNKSQEKPFFVKQLWNWEFFQKLALLSQQNPEIKLTKTYIYR